MITNIFKIVKRGENMKDWQDYQNAIDYKDAEWATDWSWSDEFCFGLNEYAAYCRDWS